MIRRTRVAEMRLQMKQLATESVEVLHRLGGDMAVLGEVDLKLDRIAQHAAAIEGLRQDPGEYTAAEAALGKYIHTSLRKAGESPEETLLYNYIDTGKSPATWCEFLRVFLKARAVASDARAVVRDRAAVRCAMDACRRSIVDLRVLEFGLALDACGVDRLVCHFPPAEFYAGEPGGEKPT